MPAGIRWIWGGISAGTGLVITSGQGNLRLDLGGQQYGKIITQSGNYNYLSSDYLVVYTGAGSATFTLLSAASVPNQIFRAKNANTGILTITGSNNIYTTGNFLSVSMANGDEWAFHSDGNKYYSY